MSFLCIHGYEEKERCMAGCDVLYCGEYHHVIDEELSFVNLELLVMTRENSGHLALDLHRPLYRKEIKLFERVLKQPQYARANLVRKIRAAADGSVEDRPNIAHVYTFQKTFLDSKLGINRSYHYPFEEIEILDVAGTRIRWYGVEAESPKVQASLRLDGENSSVVLFKADRTLDDGSGSRSTPCALAFSL
jgi:hypothetical protein